MDPKRFLLFIVCSSFAVILIGCGGGGTTTVTPSSMCGTTGSGEVPAVNDPDLLCIDCGPSPCVDESGACYSCYSAADELCFKYNCNLFCSNEPCQQGDHCGTQGGGEVPAVNNQEHTCTDCGTTPCVDSLGACYSCYSELEDKCYPYKCGLFCSSSPCDSPQTTSSVQALSTSSVMPTSPQTTSSVPALSTSSAMPTSPQTTSRVPAMSTSSAMPTALSSTTSTPALTCGTTGGGTVPTVNDPGQSCSDCGSSPCISADNVCYSCYSVGIDGCYVYSCGDGTVCQNTPCDETVSLSV